MSGHVWASKSFMDNTCNDLLFALAQCWGSDYKTSLTFAGYFVESTRQKGGQSLEALWKGALKSKHRYSKGKNGGNYLDAAERILQQVAHERWELAQGLEPQLIWDYLMDHPELLQDYQKIPETVYKDYPGD